MKTKHLVILWVALYIICAALGFVREPEGLGKALLFFSALIFFLPGFALLIRGWKEHDGKILLGLRLASGLSLLLTWILLICNFLSAGASNAAGMTLYRILGVVSAPMYCGQVWVVSLFLWACLLIGAFVRKK